MLLDEACIFEYFVINFRTVFKSVEIFDVHNCIFFTCEVCESTLRHSLEERCLAAFESDCDAAAASGVLTLLALAGCLAVAGALTAADSL